MVVVPVHRILRITVNKDNALRDPILKIFCSSQKKETQKSEHYLLREKKSAQKGTR